jgi:hypothetical protein
MASAVTKPLWNFWLPDEDRSTGWTNHCYVLQFVARGHGDTPEEAWADLVAHGGKGQREGVPEQFHLPDNLVAIRDDAEHPFSAPVLGLR